MAKTSPVAKVVDPMNAVLAALQSIAGRLDAVEGAKTPTANKGAKVPAANKAVEKKPIAFLELDIGGEMPCTLQDGRKATICRGRKGLTYVKLG